MARTKNSDNPEVAALSEILTVMQNLLIIQAANAGMTKAQVRKILGVSDSRVSDIWQHIKKGSKE